MLKNLGISCIIAFSSIGYANSEPGFIKKPVYSSLLSQSQDSLPQVQDSIKDPKENFIDLFDNESSYSAGVDIAYLNPLMLSFVDGYKVSHGKMMEDLKDKARPYFNMIDKVLSKHGLPKELKYLAVIESNLKTNARSWAGAVGPWQLMPATGRNLGLKIGRYVDERKDVYKSTHAASRYLTSLYSMYGDWLLVIAAYNSGPGKVNSAIKRSGSRDFWTLQKYLPAESRKHVKKFIATHYIMEGEGGITTLTKKETAGFLMNPDKKITTNISTVSNISSSQIISGRYNGFTLAKFIEMDLAEFQKINPRFDNQIASTGKYELKLPAEKMEVFKVKKIDILKESIQILLNPETASTGSL